jgi:hypothetical protein
LIRDFVFRKATVHWVSRCEPRHGVGDHQFGHFIFDDQPCPPEGQLVPSIRFEWHCRADLLREHARLWVGERSLGTGSMGTDHFVLNHRRNANLVEDEKERRIERIIWFSSVFLGGNQLTQVSEQDLQPVILTHDESEDPDEPPPLFDSSSTDSDDPPPLLSLTDDESEDSDELPPLLDSSSSTTLRMENRGCSCIDCVGALERSLRRRRREN